MATGDVLIDLFIIAKKTSNDELTKEFSDKVDAEFKAKTEEIMKL